MPKSEPPSLVVSCCCLCLDTVVFTVATPPPVISNDLHCHLLTLSRLLEGPEAFGCRSQHFSRIRLERDAIEDKPISQDLQVTAERPLSIFCICFSPVGTQIHKTANVAP